MQNRKTAIAHQSISWAARLLVDEHGSRAPVMADKCVADMERAGRDDLACVWQLVGQMARHLVTPPAAVTLH